MKHSYSILVMVLIVAMGILESCSQPQAPVYYDFTNFKVDSIGDVSSVVSADLKYYNPNNYNMKLKEGEVDVYLNQKLAGHSVLDSMIVIPKKDTFYLPVKMRVDMKVVLSNALNMLFSSEVNLKLVGKAKIGRSGIYMNVPILYEGRQKIPL